MLGFQAADLSLSRTQQEPKAVLKSDYESSASVPLFVEKGGYNSADDKQAGNDRSDNKETTLSSVDNVENLKVDQSHVRQEDLGSGLTFHEGVEVDAYNSDDADPNKAKDVKSGAQHFSEIQSRGNKIRTHRVNSHWRAALLYPNGTPKKSIWNNKSGGAQPPLFGWLVTTGG